MRRVALACVAIVAAVLAPEALAGYPVQPGDGITIKSTEPLFIVYRDGDEILPRVQVATRPDVSEYGFMVNGYVGSCLPYSAFTEANKFTCRLPYSLPEGTYYWLYTYSKYECQDVDYGFGTYKSCGYNFKAGPVWTFTISRAPAPTADVRSSLPTVARPTSYSRIDPNYSRIASQIVGSAVQVQCWNRVDWNSLHEEWRAYEGDRGGAATGLSHVYGYVRTGALNLINLAPQVCARLDLLRYRRKRPKAPGTLLQVANAVATLTHEAVHSYGIADEALAECYGMQYIAYTATSLGTPYAYGRRLAQAVWTRSYPLGVGTEYYTSECYDGGPLDVRPASSVWP